ncbi:MAG: DUF5683 domain-containing protein [Bacteroidota bacterium]
MRIVSWSLFAVVLLFSSSASQFQAQPDSLPSVKPITPEDSIRIVNPLTDIKASRIDTASSAYTPTKSPGLALLFSAVLPGAGQFYNESYWKIPILLGFGYYFASRWIDNNDSTRHYRDLYASSITPELQGGNARYLQLREFYKDQRDTFSWYIFIYYIVNLVDAYVDASLYDFNVGDDLSIRVRPEFNLQPVQSARVNIKISF